MEFNEFIKLLGRKKQTILIIVLVALVATAGLSLISPLKYGAKSRLLVIQNTVGTDPYTVSKSNEYLGNLFSQVVYSGSFFNFVMSSPYNIDKNYFSGSYDQQLKLWQKTVSTKTYSDTGIVEINVYHPSPSQAQQLDLAINDVLMNKNSNYQGNGNGIKVNIIDQPLVSSYPVKPNLPQNAAIAVAAGFLLSLFYIYLFPEECYNIKLFSRSRRGARLRAKKEFKPLYRPQTREEEENQYSGGEGFRPQGNIGNVLK